MFFTLFSRSKKPVTRLETNKLCNMLETYAHTRGHTYYTDTELFYHSQKKTIPFLLFDRTRGAYLFDVVPWTHKELHSATAQAGKGAVSAHNAIDVDTANRIFKRKLDESCPQEECAVCNFVYLPYLSREAFESLDPSFKTLIPASRAIFSDDSESTIAAKLADALELRRTPLNMAPLQGALFIQYTILPDALNGETRQLTPQQKHYLHASLPTHSKLSGAYGSGKTSLLLLKALYEKLRNPDTSIAIVQPTVTASELLAKELLRLLEHAVVHIDPTSIRIVTPQQICRENHIKVHRKPPLDDGQITEKMLSKATPYADMLFIDDAHLINERYLDYLRKVQHGRAMHTAVFEDDLHEDSGHYPLSHSFRTPFSVHSLIVKNTAPSPGRSFELRHGNGYILTLHLLPELLHSHNSNDIMIIVPDSVFGTALQEEIADFIGCNSTLLDPHKSLLNQDMEQLLIVPFEGLSGLQRQQIIVIRDAKTPEALVSHALGRTAGRVYIIEHTSES